MRGRGKADEIRTNNSSLLRISDVEIVKDVKVDVALS